MKSITLIFTAEHPACFRKPRKQSAFSDLVSKALVHTWLPLLLSQKLSSLGTFVRVIDIFPVWDPCTWFGFCPCDNYNPNVYFVFSL